MKEIIDNKITMESLIKINKLDRNHLITLLQEMKEFYLVYEYYMTASKLHCMIMSKTYTTEYCVQVATRLYHPLLKSVLDNLYNEQYPESEENNSNLF